MPRKILIEGEDYYLLNDRKVFTEKYHLERGFCCNPHNERGCLHCPYRSLKKDSKSSDESNQKFE